MANSLTNWQKLANPILAFIKNSVPKRVYEGIRIILNPCCPLVIDDMEITCTDTDLATIVITLEKAITFPGVIAFTLKSDLDNFVASGTFTSGDSTLTIEDAIVTTAGAATYTLALSFYTSPATNIAVQLQADFATTNPNCV